jgi:hypothetical protein
MVARVLPPAEWSRLAGTELEGVALPSHAQVIVVEDDAGTIVGCWSCVPVVHVEGVWIAPAYRGTTTVARHLWRAMGQTLRSVFDTRAAVTGAVSPDVQRLLQKRATPLPGAHYVLSWEK